MQRGGRTDDADDADDANGDADDDELTKPCLAFFQAAISTGVGGKGMVERRGGGGAWRPTGHLPLTT